MLPRASSIRRGLCLLLLSAVACLLVLLQALQLPTSNSEPAAFNDAPSGNRSKAGDNPESDAEDYSWMTKFSGPVPSICRGPDSACLERWLLSHGAHLASGDGQYRIPAILHILAIDPANLNLARVGALLLDWHRLHRNWTYVLWTGAEVHRLVSLAFRRYLPLVEGGSPLVLQHLAPILIVQKYGGALVDSSHRPTRSVDSLRRLPAVFAISGLWPAQFSADPGLFMAAPGHAFLQYCSDRTLHSPTGHGGLTRLMLDYARAFPETEKPESSLHLAPLQTTSTDSSGRGSSGKPGSGRLGILLRRCDQLSRSQQAVPGSWWPLDIGCSELLELRRCLDGGGNGLFVQSGGPNDPANRAASQQSDLRPEQLVSVFPLLNFGLHEAWKSYT